MGDSSPRVDWRLACGFAAILTVIFSLQNGIGSNSVTLWLILARQATIWGLWLVLLPFVLRSARKRPLEARPTFAWTWSQVWVGVGYCALHGILNGWMRSVLGIAGNLDVVDSMAASTVMAIGRNFITYALIVAAFQALTYHRAVREREQRAARLELDLAEARLVNLEGRLRPHFLFNTLNAIAALVRDEPAKAELLIGQLSDLLRASLRADPSREVRLDEELALVDDYLAIERTRFQDRLTVTVSATEQAREAMVPHLILQPLVENAIRHGIAPREAPGSVSVRADLVDHSLRIEVDDDGVGMGNAPPKLAGSGIGLGGVRSRLHYLYGQDQRLEVMPLTPTGTHVVIVIPYRRSPA